MTDEDVRRWDVQSVEQRVERLRNPAEGRPDSWRRFSKVPAIVGNDRRPGKDSMAPQYG